MEESFRFHPNYATLDRERARFQADFTLLSHLGSQVLENLGRV